VRWAKQLLGSGNVAIDDVGGHRPVILRNERDWLAARIAAEPHVSLRKLLSDLEAKGVVVNFGALWNFVHRRGLSLKKTVHAAEQQRPDVARRRFWWRKCQNRIDISRLVFIDETWVKTNMAPLRGWALKGQRLQGRAPHGHWKTLTFVGALRCDRVTAPCVFNGPINGECFLAYVEQNLLACLKPGDIVNAGYASA
jgi:DDE superfamily endonuclease